MGRKASVLLSPEKKMEILKDHLIKQVPVSSLSDQYGVSPANIWTWQRTLFEEGACVLARRKRGGESERRIESLESKLAWFESKMREKNDVIAELMAEHVELKKKLSGGN